MRTSAARGTATSGALVALALALTGACGGAVVGESGDGGSGVDAGADATASDGGADAGGDAARDARADASPATCQSLLVSLDAARQATRKCCPTCNTPQCTIAVKDVCCAIGASSTAAAQQFEAKVSEYVAQCGPIGCPATPCIVEPSNVCDPATSLCR